MGYDDKKVPPVVHSQQPEDMQRKSFPHRILEILKLVTVEPFVFFCLIGYTIRGVSFQSLLMDRACRNMYDFDDATCDKIDDFPSVQAKSMVGGNNLYTGVMLTASLPALVVAIFLGPWSDKYSRKYPILLAVSGMFTEATLSAVLSYFPHVSPWLYVVTSLCSGVTGGFVMTVSSCVSYLSDITDARSRASRFAVLEFFNILAMVLGGFLGGQIYKAFGYETVMSLAPASLLVAMIYGVVCLKDTKPKVEKGKRLDMMKDLVALDNIKQSYHTCTRPRPGNMRLQIWLLVWISCCSKLASMGVMAIGFPFARKMYLWGVTDYSNANIIFSLTRAVVTVVVIPLLSRKLLLHEAAIGLIGVCAETAMLTFMSVASTIPLFFIASISGSLSSAVSIGVKSRLSKLVHKDELGRAFSFLGIFESLTPLFGTVLFLQIYNATVETFPGLAFAASAALSIPSGFIFAWMMRMPTVSLGEFGREEEMAARQLEDIKPSSTNYDRLEEEKY